MSVNFPNDPQINDVFTKDDRSWRWTGVYWRAFSTTVGYTGSQGFTGSQGISFNISGVVSTSISLPVPYLGDINDYFLVEDSGLLWVWDGSSWGPLGRFTGYTGSQGDPGAPGAPGTSVRILGSVPTVADLPTDGTSDGSTLLLIGDGLIVSETGDFYIWSGSSWSNVGKIRGESSFTWGPTPPENPEVGARWFDTSEGALAVYVDDGDSFQWVEVAASGFLGRTGFTGSAGIVDFSNIPSNMITNGTIRANNPFFLNPKVVAANYTIPANSNAMSAGPIEIAPGVTVVISDGAEWSIV